MRVWRFSFAMAAVLVAVVPLVKAAANEIRILEATYGDSQSKKTCKPDLSICKGLSTCAFVVDDGLCKVNAPVKNLEVTLDCGDGTPKKVRAAAKGTKITLSCP